MEYRKHPASGIIYTLESFCGLYGEDGPTREELRRHFDSWEKVEVHYDSKTDTLLHIKRVAELLNIAARELLRRAEVHDRSKLHGEEKAGFDKMTPRLAGSTYGSEEYKAMLVELKPALDHHYASNSHHPEHYRNGINGMDLLDLIEMFFDWCAATERHKDGNLFKSIDINQGRFGISEQLKQILQNTAAKYGDGTTVAQHLIKKMNEEMMKKD